jgi:hypothetical protein
MKMSKPNPEILIPETLDTGEHDIRHVLACDEFLAEYP